MVVVRNDGERLFLANLSHQNSYSLNHDREFLLDAVNPGDFLHISGYFMLPRLRVELPSFLQEAQNRKVRISFDPGWDSNGFTDATRAELFHLLSFVEFFEPNETELKAISGKPTILESIEELSRRYKGIVALKQGERGSRIFDRNRSVTKVASFPTQVIDSTGAGDVFDAGFIHGLINQRSLEDSAKIGNAAAALLISRKGVGSSRFPTATEIADLVSVER